MNYKDITIGIVAFKSAKVIFNCLKSIEKIKEIIIFDNSNDIFLKKKIQNKYPLVRIILSKRNIGYGRANNEIFKLAKTPYVLVLNPDTMLERDCLKKLLDNAKNIKNNFAIIAPTEKNKKYKFFKRSKKINYVNKNLIEVEFVRGFAMLVNLKKIKKIGMFDKNYFLYLEEIDLCKRLKLRAEKIYLCKNAKVKHIGAKSSDIGFEFEKCRNWHWTWSKFYFDKKFYNYAYAISNCSFKLITNVFKMIFFLLIMNLKKAQIYYLRSSGTFNSLLGNNSWYRPNLN